jgi:hypothetical protein
MTLGDEPLPWEQRRTPLAYLHTALLILFRPHDAARALWAPRRLDMPAAQAFRRWSLLLATPVLCAIAWIITSRVIGRAAATWCLVLDAAAIILWLNAATIGPVAFFRDKASGILLKRVQTLAHYTCAPLVLLAVPAQVALLLVTRDTTVASEPGWLLAAAVHVGVLIALMGLGLIFMAWLMYETVQVSAAGAFAFTFAAATGALGSAAVLLICLPAMFAAMIARIVP